MTENKAISTSNAGSNLMTRDEMRNLQQELDQKQTSALMAVIDGVRVIPDETGMMCPSNGYIVIVGKRLWQRLQEFKP